MKREAQKHQKRLRFDLVIIPQQDNEYLGGVNGLLDWMAVAQKNGDPLPIEIGGLWHNHFAPLASAEDIDSRSIPHDPKDLAALTARRVGIPVNEPFDYFVASASAGPAKVVLESGMTITVMGPTPKDLESLHKSWRVRARMRTAEDFTGPSERAEKRVITSLVDQTGGFIEGYSSPQIELIRAPDIETEAIGSDTSVANLSSMLLLLEYGGKRLLLCGDAEGGQIIRGLMSAGLLRPDSYSVFDAIHIPHAGSVNNVSPDFFRRVRADRYIFSGDGTYGNPERETLQMLFEARGDARYEVYFNYPIDEIDGLREKEWTKFQHKEKARKKENPDQEVRPDWSPEKQSLAALIAEHSTRAHKAIVIDADRSHVVDLTEGFGRAPPSSGP